MSIPETGSWNTIAREYDALIARGDFFRTHLLDDAFADLVGGVSSRRILDAGCGQGYFSARLSKSGANVTAIDGSDELIACAKERFPESPSLRFMAGNLKDPLPYGDGSFDGVVAHMVLMDFDPIDRAFSEFSRVLNPEGFLAFSILHPFFIAGKTEKSFMEKILYRLPHLSLSRYHTAFARSWRIPGTSHDTDAYHRPFESYARMLRDASFHIEDVREPVFDARSLSGKSNAMKLLAEIPPFLLVRARRCAKP